MSLLAEVREHCTTDPISRFVTWCPVASIAFCRYVMGLTGAEPRSNSMRLQGAAPASYLKKRKRRQRQPLRAEQVKKLELFAAGEIPGRESDRLGARCSDGLNLKDLFVDCPKPTKFPLYRFAEGCVAWSKTSYTTERKALNLPMGGSA